MRSDKNGRGGRGKKGGLCLSANRWSRPQLRRPKSTWSKKGKESIEGGERRKRKKRQPNFRNLCVEFLELTFCLAARLFTQETEIQRGKGKGGKEGGKKQRKLTSVYYFYGSSDAGDHWAPIVARSDKEGERREGEEGEKKKGPSIPSNFWRK